MSQPDDFKRVMPHLDAPEIWRQKNALAWKVLGKPWLELTVGQKAEIDKVYDHGIRALHANRP